MSDGLPRFEFSEITNRVRRNLVAAAFLLIVIKLSGVTVNGSTTFGVAIEGLSTTIVTWAIVAFLIYHLIAFSLRSFEDYRFWVLTFTDHEVSTWDSPAGMTESFLHKLKEAKKVFDKVIEKNGAFVKGRDDDEFFSAEDADKLKSVSAAADIYLKRMNNFPKLMRFRFWIWDIAVAWVLSGLALFCSLL